MDYIDQVEITRHDSYPHFIESMTEQPGHSRARWQALIDEDRVTVNGEPLKRISTLRLRHRKFQPHHDEYLALPHGTHHSSWQKTS